MWIRITNIGLVALLMVFSAAASSYAEDLSVYPNTAVTILGAQGGTGYFNFVGGPAAGTCIYSIIFFDATTPAGKNMYATLLGAKLTGASLTRVDYTVDSWTCTLQLVQL
jgi:hypothetical protein